MDDLQIARATALRDIFGYSDSGSSSYENLGCENNTISLADEITSLNVVQEQDLNISSHHLPVVGMLFDSVDELLTAYQDHAKEKGFVVAIRSSVRDTNASGQFKYVSISCDRGRNTYFEKHSKRINCPAKNELKADFDSKNEVMKLHSGFHWERQFHDAYTKDIFKKVRKEIADMIYCHLDPNNEIDASSVPGVEKFNIKECSITNWYCKEFLYTVEFRANGQYFDCNCRKFDFCGLLCKHIFEVMKIKNITRVHERYILRRWRKDVLRRHSSIVYSGAYPHMTDEYKKYQEIERALHEAVDLCKNNPASMGFLKREMDALIEKIRSGDIQVDQAQHMDNDASIEDPNYASIRDPNYVRCRGRPRLNRFRSFRKEEIVVKGKVLAGRSVVDELLLFILEETLEAPGAFAEYESKSYEKLVSSIEDHPSKDLIRIIESEIQFAEEEEEEEKKS
ncbi:hypothetical protein Scep_026342 [Stephania cephalantha]|uniref:SWIM-type domain-containing protein n=1 Tax=Stephania cephalantha TaxID=152367 RepID=A0AAP0HN34_9MAGN